VLAADVTTSNWFSVKHLPLNTEHGWITVVAKLANAMGPHR